jgi:hypothetical protein
MAYGKSIKESGECPPLLPAPYSPELNPAEHLWDEIREKWFPNLVFHHMDGVEDALMEALIALENDPDRVRGLTGFDWIINAILIAT